MVQGKFMKIRELAQAAGVPRSTIQFYLREGLLHAPIKTGRTMAYYDEGHLKKLKLIKRLKQDLRMPIAFLKKELKEMEGVDGAAGPVAIAAVAEDTDPRESRKAEIVRTAIEVFSRKGYHNARVSDITRRAGISTGTFYVYFENKRELFIEVVEDVFRHIVGAAARSIKDEDDLGKRLVIRGRTFYENYSRYMEILNQLRAEIASDEDWPQEKLNRMYQALTGPVIREARQGIERGEVRPVDPELLAFALTGLIEIMSFRISLDDKYTIDDALRFIGDLLLNGLPAPAYKDRWQLNDLL
ncbi:MAG TPA: TetR family transcriptional regulator [bacterium]|nr:TetR family transcriptional regulator [bacterium]